MIAVENTNDMSCFAFYLPTTPKTCTFSCFPKFSFDSSCSMAQTVIFISFFFSFLSVFCVFLSSVVFLTFQQRKRTGEKKKGKALIFHN